MKAGSVEISVKEVVTAVVTVYSDDSVDTGFSVCVVVTYMSGSGEGWVFFIRSICQIPTPSIIIMQQLKAMAVLLNNIAFLRFFSSKYSSLR